MLEIWNQYVALVDGIKIIILIVLILADFLLGIIVALKTGTFKLSKIASFLNTTVLCMIGGYLIVGAIALVHPDFKYLVVATWGVLDLALLAGLWIKLSKLGVPIPKAV